MSKFIGRAPTREDCWRAVILFGNNVASYKFALGTALLELATGDQELIRLEDLAEPYARHLCEHLRSVDKQGTFARSKFLDACRAHGRGELDADGLRRATVRLGFQNVIDAFHVVSKAEVPTRFFLDERPSAGGIRLTDHMRELAAASHSSNLPLEVDARWRLVETAWQLNLPRRAIEVSADPSVGELFVQTDRNSRRSISGVRQSLNGYQRGRCFYCAAPLLALDSDVDHFIPHRLKPHMPGINLDGVWNLVLACCRCNRGVAGKSDRVPALKYLERLHTRSEWLIESHHPLRETLLLQTGTNSRSRRTYLQQRWNEARSLLIHTWAPMEEMEASW